MNYDYTNFNDLERRDELKSNGDIRALNRAVWRRTSKDRRTVVYVTYQLHTEGSNEGKSSQINNADQVSLIILFRNVPFEIEK